MDKEKRLPLGNISIKDIPTMISFVDPSVPRYMGRSEEYRFSHIEKGNAVYIRD